MDGTVCGLLFRINDVERSSFVTTVLVWLGVLCALDSGHVFMC